MRRLLPILLGVFGCAETTALDLPEAPEAGALFIFLARPGEAPRLLPIAPADARATALALHAEDELVLAYHRTTLVRLGIEAGTWRTSESDGELLPAPFAVYRRVLGGWSADPALGPPFDAFRLRQVTPRACLDAERCYDLDPTIFACVDCEPPPTPEPPAPPALPIFLPCPTGWAAIETSTETPTVCTPHGGDAETLACAGAQRGPPSEAACRTIGDPCPAGEWPDPLPAGPEWRYVGSVPPAGAPPARVYATAAAALVDAQPGDRILLAQGRHALRAIGVDVEVAGTCVAGTELVGSGTVSIAAGVRLRQLRLGDAVQVRSGARFEMFDVWSTRRVVVEAGATASVARSRVEGRRWIVFGDLSVEGSSWLGPGARWIGDGASGSLRDVEAIGSEEDPGFFAEQGAALQLEACHLEGYTDAVLVVRGPLTLSHVYAHGARTAVKVLDGAVAELRRVRARESRDVGVVNARAVLRMEDVIWEDGEDPGESWNGALISQSGEVCTPEATETTGSRLFVYRQGARGLASSCATARYEDLTILRNDRLAVSIDRSIVAGARWEVRDSRTAVLLSSDPGVLAQLELTDLNARQLTNEAVAVGESSDAHLTRVLIRKVSRFGVAVRGIDSHALLEDLLVDEIRIGGAENACLHVAADLTQPSAVMEVERFSLDSALFGVDVRASSVLRLRRGTISDMRVALKYPNDLDPREMLRGVRLESNQSSGLP